MEKNYYIPQIFKVKKVIQETEDTKTLFINKKTAFVPGQFMQLSVFGLGQAPISISSAPEDDCLEFTVKGVGAVTNELIRLQKKDVIGIRGPFGKGFNIKELENKHLILVAMDLGIVTIRSILRHCLTHRKKFLRISLMYGVTTSGDLIYEQEIKSLLKNPNISASLSVEQPDPSWKDNVGSLTDLLDKLNIKSRNTAALVCAPSMAMHSYVKRLIKKGISPKCIWVSLERHMDCGVGKCGHCYIGEYFVCKDGPVFRFSDLDKLKPEGLL